MNLRASVRFKLNSLWGYIGRRPVTSTVVFATPGNDDEAIRKKGSDWRMTAWRTVVGAGRFITMTLQKTPINTKGSAFIAAHVTVTAIELGTRILDEWVTS
jgi:hypothetical protein